MRVRQFALLHGFLGHVDFWRETRQHLQRAFPGATTHAVNLPGHGDSRFFESDAAGIRGEPAHFFDAVEWFVSVTQELAPCWAVGYSMGARLALGALLRYPSQFSGAVLISCHPGIDDEDERQKRQQWEQHLQTLLEGDQMAPLVNEFEQLPIFASQTGLSTAAQNRQRLIRLSHRPAHIRKAIPLLGLGHTPPLGPQLTQIDRPTLLVTGALDTRYTALATQITARHAALSHVTIAAAGHNPILENPAATFDAITQFVRANP